MSCSISDEHLVADAREAALGVAHRRGAVAVERAEVARAVDERVAQREGLRHAHQRLVERGVAVRVVAAHHVADDLGALAVLGVDAVRFCCHIVKRMRRCTGLRPSRTSGSAREVMTDSA